MKSSDLSSYDDTRKILLVGDIEKAFLNPDTALKNNLEVCTNLTEALDIAGTKNYSAIAIVLSGAASNLNASLKTLKENCSSRIILLAQMYEEPIAMQLTNQNANGTRQADDYIICPVGPDTLYKYVTKAKVKNIPESAAPVTLDTTIETKIKYLEKLATEDDLTGLKNRRYIWEFSRQIIELSKKQNGKVTLLVFDIDNFKRYNDVYGHYAGDEILKQAAILIRRCCRSHDVVGRIGGDEFAVVFWDDPHKICSDLSGSEERRSSSADHPKDAIFIAKRFVKELERTDMSALSGLGPEGKGVLTISGGLASFPQDGQTIQQIFMQADKALLEAKKSGKNRIYLVGKAQSNINQTE